MKNMVKNEIVLHYPYSEALWGGHYGLTGRIIKNLKLPKKLRQGAQNSGKITSNLELITFFAIH